jgi:hypothetical protein
MTPAAFATELAATADEALWPTNPVWCVERLVKRWAQRDASWVHLSVWLPRLLDHLARRDIFLPHRALDRWTSHSGPLSGSEGIAFTGQPCPGVVGLIVDVGLQEAWAVPLVAERAAEWAVDTTLPFHPATTLQDLLLKLLQSLNLPRLDRVPERFAFTLRDPLGRRSDGPSMHVAGLLAVVREANGRPPPLDRACAVVETHGDCLAQVGSVRPKLDAFLRECGSGTLLVRCRECAEAARYDSDFDDVWEVDSLAELARELERAGWLDVFLAGQQLSAVDAATVSERVRRLEGSEHGYAEALDLSNRAERCGFGPDVPTRLRRELRQTRIDLYRHLGAYGKSAELAEEDHRLSRTSRASSYDDQARADLTYASALFAPHRFGEICRLLDPWREQLTADPLRVTPLTRVMVFNTLGRALVALGRAGWEELFRRSEELLGELEPIDLPRTWSYLAHGYLRDGRLSEAEEVLRRIAGHPRLGDMSRWFLRFYQADVARRRGETWADPEMERAVVSRRVGHPFGFYLQATARQPGRDTDDALNRFRRAREFLAQDEPDGDGRNIQRFLSACIRLAEAAWASDQRRWDESSTELERQLAPHPGLGLSDHYTGYLPAIGSVPARETAERLLSRVPFF